MKHGPSTSELNQIFAAARSGSRSAIEALLGALHGHIYRKARRFTAGMPQAIGPSSLTQEVSLALSRLITRVRGSRNATLFRLLDRLVQSKGISAHRREAAEKRYGGRRETWDDGAEFAAESVGDPYEQLVCAQREHRLLVAIARLPNRQRNVIEGLLVGTPVSELAQQLRCSPAAVYNMLQRAKQSLEPSDFTPPHDCLDAALSAYQEQLKKGSCPNAASIAARYPEAEQEVFSMLDWLDRLRRAWYRDAN